MTENHKDRTPFAIILHFDGKKRSFTSKAKGTNALNRMLQSGYEMDSHQTTSSADVYVLSRRPQDMSYDTDNPKVRSLIEEYGLTDKQTRRLAMYTDGMTFEEIAAAEDINTNAARVSIYQTKKKMER